MKVDASECLRVLGVTPDATPETIRQAYLDLVRVWHPDRFQSDHRLREIADRNLREINRAFDGLKNYRAGAASGRPDPPLSRKAPGNPAASNPRSSQPASSRPASSQPSSSQPPPVRSRAPSNRRATRLAAMVAAAAMCALVLTAAQRIVTYLHEAPPADPPPAENAVPRKIEAAPAKRIRGAGEKSNDTRIPETAVVLSAPPANGTELFRAAGFRGFGELVLVNHTDLEGVARLVGRSGAALQAIYIAPGARAAFHSVAHGVYSLHADLGTGLDAESLRFLNRRLTPQPIGPMEFLEFTNEQGITGSHFEVALRR
jgi:hypothetical protein